MSTPFDFPSIATAAVAACGKFLSKQISKFGLKNYSMTQTRFFKPDQLADLDKRISRLATNYGYLMTEILKECVAFHTKNSGLKGSELTQHFLEFLKQKIIDVNAFLNVEDIVIEENENLSWAIYGKNEDTPLNERKIIFINSNFSSLFEETSDWGKIVGQGLNPFTGLTDIEKIDEEALQKSLAYTPPKLWWPRLTFGKGTIGGLQGIAAAIVSMKIMVEILTGTNTSLIGNAPPSPGSQCFPNSLEGVVVISSIAKSHHPYFHVFDGVTLYPDVIILSEATGRIHNGPCTIAIGQNGLAMMDVSVNGGFSIEDGARVIAEAAAADYNRPNSDPILGPVSRTVTDALIAPMKFSARFARTLSVGESGNDAIEEIEQLPTVEKALAFGGSITLSEFESFPAWKTPQDNPMIKLAVETYLRTISPHNVESENLDSFRSHPDFSGRGKGDNKIGYPIISDLISSYKDVSEWISYGDKIMPPTFAIGSGFVDNCGKPGEFINNELVWGPIAVISRFPSLLSEKIKHK